MQRGTSLSEKIKITVVTDNEKPHAKETTGVERKTEVTHDVSETLLSTLVQNGLAEGSFCQGRGQCGRCRVRYLSPAPIPSAVERKLLSPDELRDGIRLACMSRPGNDSVISMDFAEDSSISIVTGIAGDMIEVSEKNDCSGQRKSSSLYRKTPVPDRPPHRIIAVDLGTTTIAMYLRETSSGRIENTYCELNPQRCYGADVLSRIQASCEGRCEVLREAVWKALRRGVDALLGIRLSGQQDGTDKITYDNISMCIAGNTTMIHLLMGYDVSELGQSPFRPVTLGFLEERFEKQFPIYIVPGISAFVGGDIVAGLYALAMLPGRGKAQNTALVDLGTNGEIVVRDADRMLAAATAAGPAFEGGASSEIIGTDMVALTAALRREQIIDATGLMREPYFEQGVTVRVPGGKSGHPKTLRIRQEDIRALQLAKAAVRAGVETLQAKLGESCFEHVWLAGGFGYELDTEAAFEIGLLPENLRGCVRAVGNTSLEGAYQIGRDLADGKLTGQRLEHMVRTIAAVNLAEEEGFEKRYLAAMNF